MLKLAKQGRYVLENGQELSIRSDLSSKHSNATSNLLSKAQSRITQTTSKRGSKVGKSISYHSSKLGLGWDDKPALHQQQTRAFNCIEDGRQQNMSIILEHIA